MIAVYQVTREAVERARRGEGVTLIELVTYRRTGHAEHDNQAYIPADEVKSWEKKDPIARFVERGTEAGWFTAAEIAEMDSRIAVDLDAAIGTVEAEPDVPAEFALGDVYAAPSTQHPALST